MKKLLLAGLTIFISLYTFAYHDPSINEKLLKVFRDRFPHAERVIWNESVNYYEVSFVEEGILTRIAYEKSGDFAFSYRYYSEQNLPYYAVNILKKRYPGQTIFGVTEVSVISGVTYYIKLEGPKYWITVKLDGENSSVVEKYRKM
jgi:hypothetical protein